MAINQFGGYSYDRYCILEEHSDSESAKLRTGDRLGEDGGYTGGGLTATGRISVQGKIIVPPTGTPNIREIWREFRAAHMPGTPRPLRIPRYFGEAHIWCEVEGVADNFSQGQNYIAARQFEVSFHVADPSIYADQEQGPQVLSVGGSTNINNAGYRYAEPAINFVVTFPGTVVITHDKGQHKTVAHLAGTYSVNSRDRYVTRNTANFHYGWDGTFPQFRPGQTSVNLTITSPGTATNATARWFNRD